VLDPVGVAEWDDEEELGRRFGPAGVDLEKDPNVRRGGSGASWGSGTVLEVGAVMSGRGRGVVCWSTSVSESASGQPEASRWPGLSEAVDAVRGHRECLVDDENSNRRLGRDGRESETETETETDKRDGWMDSWVRKLRRSRVRHVTS
jgi:hypothetical protein